MSIEVMQSVWRESASDGRARLVLLAIADHQGEIGAWPSLETLARMVNSSVRSVQRDIQYLQQLGELIVLTQQAPSRSQYKSNLYWVNLPSVRLLINPEILPQPGVTDSVSGVTELTSGVTESASGVTAGGILTLNRTITEPLLNISSDFEKFWNVYPRKVAKKSALKAWVACVTRDNLDDVVAGAIRFAHDPNLPVEQFIPHPSTWLRSERWLDGPLPERQMSPEEREAKELAAIARRRELDRKHAEEILEADRLARETADAPRCEHGKLIVACMPCIKAGKV
jgi:hypothetical protein